MPRMSRCLSILLALTLSLVASSSWAQEDDDGTPPPAPTPAQPDAPPADPPPADSAEPDAQPPKDPEGDKEPAGKDPPAGDADHEAPPPPEPTGDDAGHNEAGEPTPEAPGADDYDIEDAKAAGYEVGDATGEAVEGGLGVDGKDYDLPDSTFEGMEGLDAKDLEALTEVTPAELGEVDVDRDMTPQAEEQLNKQALAIEGLTPENMDKIAQLFVKVLREQLAKVRAKTWDKTVDKMREKNAARIGKVTGILLMLSAAGLLLLLLPFTQMKKFPGQAGKLFGYAAMAGASLTMAILLMTGVLFVMRTVQASLGEQSNPQLVIVDASFEAIDNQIVEIAGTPGLLMVPMQQVTTGEKEDINVAILENASQFKKDFEIFKSIGTFFKSISWIFGYVPIVLTGLAVVLFFVTIKDLIKDIIKAPERAMKGEIKGSEVFTMVVRRVINEMIVTLITMSVLVLITLLTAFALTAIAYPAMDTFIRQLMVTLQYVFIQPGASKAFIYIALLGVIFYLVLSVLVLILSGTFYLGKIQAIFRAVFNNKVPLKTFKPFFIKQTLGMVWCMAIPILTMLAGSKLGLYLSDKATSGKQFNWTLALLPAPLSLLAIFAILFFVARGLKSLLGIIKYKVPTQITGDAALGQVVAALPNR